MARGLLAMVVVALGVLGVYSFVSPHTKDAAAHSTATSAPDAAAAASAAASDTAALPPLTTTAPVAAPPVAAAPVRVPITVLNATTVNGLAGKAAKAFSAKGWQAPAVGAYTAGDIAASTVYFTQGDEQQRQAAVQLVDQFPQLTGPAPRFFQLPAGVTAPGLVVVLDRRLAPLIRIPSVPPEQRPGLGRWLGRASHPRARASPPALRRPRDVRRSAAAAARPRSDLVRGACRGCRRPHRGGARRGRARAPTPSSLDTTPSSRRPAPGAPRRRPGPRLRWQQGLGRRRRPRPGRPGLRRPHLLGARLRSQHRADRPGRPAVRGRRPQRADRPAGQAARGAARRARRSARGRGRWVLRRRALAAGCRLRPPDRRDRPADHLELAHHRTVPVADRRRWVRPRPRRPRRRPPIPASTSGCGRGCSSASAPHPPVGCSARSSGGAPGGGRPRPAARAAADPGRGDAGADLRPVPRRHLRRLPVGGGHGHAHAGDRRGSRPQQPGRRARPHPRADAAGAGHAGLALRTRAGRCQCPGHRRERHAGQGGLVRRRPRHGARPTPSPRDLRDRIAGWFDWYLRKKGTEPGHRFRVPVADRPQRLGRRGGRGRRRRRTSRGPIPGSAAAPARSAPRSR